MLFGRLICKNLLSFIGNKRYKRLCGGVQNVQDVGIGAGLVGGDAVFGEGFACRVEPYRFKSGGVCAFYVSGEGIPYHIAVGGVEVLYLPPYEFEKFAFGLSAPHSFGDEYSVEKAEYAAAFKAAFLGGFHAVGYQIQAVPPEFEVAQKFPRAGKKVVRAAHLRLVIFVDRLRVRVE